MAKVGLRSKSIVREAGWHEILRAIKDGTRDIYTSLLNAKSLQVGGSSDFTEIMVDGTLRAHGEATAWDDLRVPIEGTKKLAGKEAKDVVYKGGVITSFEDGGDQAITWTVQLPHAWKEGTDIEFHIHYVLPISGSESGAENVKFVFTHSWANINEVFPDATTVNVTTDFQTGVAHTSGIIEMVTLDAEDKTLSSQIICSLTRDTSVADNLAQDIYVTEVDFHYQVDGFGSAQEYTKDPA